MDYLDIPAFLRQQLDGDEMPVANRTTADIFVDRLNRVPSTWLIPQLLIDDLTTLKLTGLEQSIFDELVSIVNRGFEEATVILVFLYVLSKSKAGHKLHRDVSRSVRTAFKGRKMEHSIVKALETEFSALPDWYL